jgi:hypothetical protein
VALKLWQALALTAALGLAVGLLLGRHTGSGQTTETVAGPTVTHTVTVRHVVYRTRTTHTTPAAAPKKAPPKRSPSPSAKLTDKDFTLEALQIRDDGAGDIGGIMRVTNIGSVQRTATFELTFFQNSQIVGTAVGSANAVAPGQTVTVDLASQDPMISGTFRYAFQVSAEF